MSKILITGGAGELGATFANLCLSKGNDVRIMDIIRFNEAWRLKWLNIQNDVYYSWKSTFDIDKSDINDVDIILDCACQPDRPLGITSPIHTLQNNLLGTTSLLKAVSKRKIKPIVIYPSSCNVFLGVPSKLQPLTEKTKPMPVNYYAWSKLAAEELYLMYNRVHKIPTIVIRTGSAYGPGMRTDQMIAKCILHMLNNKKFNVKSPEASRTYTFTQDIVKFYDKLLDYINNGDLNDVMKRGLVIHNGGNKENKPYKTFEVAEKIKYLTDSDAELYKDKYELGEIIDDSAVTQWESYEGARRLLNWTPEHSLEDGLKKTIYWFEQVVGEYTI